jgi:hypothetical protein
LIVGNDLILEGLGVGSVGNFIGLPERGWSCGGVQKVDDVVSTIGAAHGNTPLFKCVHLFKGKLLHGAAGLRVLSNFINRLNL